MQGSDLKVLGPRYWSQPISAPHATSSTAASQPASAARTVYVQRKQGALSYADDPSGMQGLLARTLRVRRGSRSSPGLCLQSAQDLCFQTIVHPQALAHASNADLCAVIKTIRGSHA